MTLLADLTWPEAARLAAEGALLAIPVGSTEQHGPHLPLSTDTDIAAALAGRLAARRPGVVIAPPVSYGSSGEHAGFAGTLSIGQAALELVLTELGRSAAETFGHLVFVCAHGGNAVPAGRAVARLRAESRDVLLWMPAPLSGTELPPPDAHAGRTETALQLALTPDRVRAGLAQAGNTAPLAGLMPALQAGGVRAVSGNGVLGDPAGASAPEGARLLDRLAADLTAAAEAWYPESAQERA
ncbi:MAG TPA: mycofactocin biosynthesis peptidyl-dipeptidase MftE [Streptosporangiaceae bacterium]|nr:mycofactocin biosynthesis peptidyl-dipeptidase MftE [Streptosporangiaceae bacterium]